MKLELVLKNGERGFQREDTERKDILESCGGRWGAGKASSAVTRGTG